MDNGITEDNKINDGYQKLHWASYFDDIDVFISELALPTYSTCQLDSIRSRRGATCLHVAASNNSLIVLRYVVSNISRNIIHSVNELGESALHNAVTAGHGDAVQVLLQAGASITMKDKWGRNPYQV